ncbi:MAG: hypothetical protein N2643_03090 [Endomicrobia bacterium]|nr:hypothetical protein [Endomicrobiia bacterium]
MNKKKRLFLFFLSIFILINNFGFVNSQQNYYPIYITGGVPINEYTLFANAGWDGNWYVGSNMCWIKKFKKELLPQKELFSKVYIAAKLGRAKTKPKQNAPSWEKETIDGNIYVAVSSTPAWKSNQRYFLCKVSDIPTEGDWENAINTTGEAKWFYTEIPIEKIDFNQDVWVCIYSNTPYLNSASSAPIIAGAWREKDQKEFNIWLNNEINGTPPIDPSNSLKTQIRVFDPSIIIKLIPNGAEELPVKIRIAQITDGRPENDEKVFYIDALTPNIDYVYMEISSDKQTYNKLSKYIYSQPYAFNLNLKMVPEEISGDFWIRFTAKDIFGNTGYTEPVQLNIIREQQKKDDKQKKK